MTKTSIGPTHKLVQTYYRTLEDYTAQKIYHETAVRSAFQNLLADSARTHGWMLIPELSSSGTGRVVPDGTLRDANGLPRGYWEAKDTKDDLNAEIRKKIARGYPLTNIIFEDTREGVLFQNKEEVFRANLKDASELTQLLQRFYAFLEPDIEQFEQAVEEFKERVPELASGLAAKIADAHTNNKKFILAFEGFFTLCQTALNPNISRGAVDEMLVQHLLTERLIASIFNKPEFTQQNVIAVEVEKVITALAVKSFSRKDYLKSLDRFYVAIENAARSLPDFADKQHFLNTVYERFFQGYSVKVADTHGIIYTPQPIVDFMCASVAEVLQKGFQLQLGSKGVNILDPCTGTGNFIVNILRRLSKRDLERVYTEQLFANEIMLLPYYIAALNIEHAFYEITAAYEPFPGLCFVDTLDLAEAKQTGFAFMTEENTSRVERQRKTPITVIIGNPPYNTGQQNENDNNKNRAYKVIDDRIRDTYAKDSKATLKNKLYDAYVRFFRWAVDRLGGTPGVVCMVTNNSFVDQNAFDGMQGHLLRDFDRIYHVDLHGNVRRNPKLSGTVHNVFGIQTGVGITVAVRYPKPEKLQHRLFYHRVPEDWRRDEKLRWLGQVGTIGGVEWNELPPHKWLSLENAGEFGSFLPMGTKEAKAAKEIAAEAIFKSFSLGVATNRDEWVYDFSVTNLTAKVKRFIKNYNYEVFRLGQEGKKDVELDDFVNNDPSFLKWTDRLKEHLRANQTLKFESSLIRTALYRPFTKKRLYFDPLLNHRQYLQRRAFPTAEVERENVTICCTNHTQVLFGVHIANCIPDQAIGGRGGQCFPMYVYDETGGSRVDNITDWAVAQFRQRYAKKVTKAEIFYYVYAVLHHPVYQSEFAQNLRRDLPHIPFVEDFSKAAGIGQQLAKLHLGFEDLDPYELQWVETPSVPLTYRVDDKLTLSKDKTALTVNKSLSLTGIPPEVFSYRICNRSGLEWVISQFQVEDDHVTGLRTDPNREDDEEYIVRLIGQVVRASIESVALVNGLPSLSD